MAPKFTGYVLAGALIILTFTVEPIASSVKLRSMETFTDIRMNLAVTWVKFSYTADSLGYNVFKFSLPIPSNAVLSNLTIMTSSYNIFGIVTPVSIEELHKKLAKPRRKPNYREFELVEIDKMTVYGGESVTALLCYEQLLEMKDYTVTHTLYYQPFSPVISSFKADVRVVEPQGIQKLLSHKFLADNNPAPEEDARLPQGGTVFQSKQKTHVQMKATTAQLQYLNEQNIRGKIVLRYKVDHLPNGSGKFYVSDLFFLYKFSPTTLEPLPRNAVFLMDRSASAEGIKLQAIKDTFASLLRNLTSSDKFTVMRFSSDVEVLTSTLLKKSQEVNQVNCLLPANEYNKLIALEFISRIQAQGDTDINKALMTALDCLPQPYDAINMIYFVTDGKANIGVADTHKIMTSIKARQRILKTKAHLISVGLGSDVDFAFVQQLSRQNEGFATSVAARDQNQMTNEMTEFFLTYSQPVLRNIIVTLPEMQVSDISSTAFATFYRGCEIWLAGKLTNDSKDATLQASVYGRATDGSLFITDFGSKEDYPDILNQNPIKDKPNSPVERIYALKRVEEKLAQASLKNLGGHDRVVLWSEVQLLSAKYSFKTDVMDIDMAADVRSEREESLKLANKNYLQALENKAKEVKVPERPKDYTKKEEAFEGADGDPHFIVTLRDLNLCFNVDGHNQSWVNLLTDARRGIEIKGMITADKDFKNEAASFFTVFQLKLFPLHKHSANQITTFRPIEITLNTSFVDFEGQIFSWKQGAIFKHGRILLKMVFDQPECEISLGDKVRVKIVRHIRVRKDKSSSKYSFLGVYIMNNTRLTASSSGFLGKQFFKNVSVVKSDKNGQNEAFGVVSINKKRFPAKFSTVIDNSSMTKKQCWKLMGNFWETFSNFTAIN